MINVIGLSGRAGCGKSTAAEFISLLYGHTRIRFARPLKSMCYALGMSTDEIEGPLKETPIPRFGNKSPRFIMQTLGTDWGRNTISPSLWIDLWLDEARKHTLVIAEDVRFPNEADAIHSLGGSIIRIERPDNRHSTSLSTHASENLDFPPDFTIENNSTLDIFKHHLALTIDP